MASSRSLLSERPGAVEVPYDECRAGPRVWKGLRRGFSGRFRARSFELSSRTMKESKTPKVGERALEDEYEKALSKTLLSLPSATSSSRSKFESILPTFHFDPHALLPLPPPSFTLPTPTERERDLPVVLKRTPPQPIFERRLAGVERA